MADSTVDWTKEWSYRTGSSGSGGSGTGTAATIKIGTVTTGAAGSSVKVTNSGTSSAAVFNFTIPRGDTGETGATGETGPQGEKGDTGETGAAGTNGTTPVRGTDYWTEEDVATIKSYVDESITQGTW